jgi:hypothetical protein
LEEGQIMPKSKKIDSNTSRLDAVTGGSEFEIMLKGVYGRVRHPAQDQNRNRNQISGKGKTQTRTRARTIRNTTTDVADPNSGNNITIMRLTDEERTKLEKTMLFCFSSLFKFDPALVGGEKFTSTAQMRATPPPAVLELGRDPLPELILDVNVLPDTPLVYGRTSSIWGEVHPYLEVPVNLHYAWKLLNYEEIFVLTMHYGLKRPMTDIAQGLGFNGTTRLVNTILNNALLKLAPALLDLPIPITVVDTTIEGLEGGR